MICPNDLLKNNQRSQDQENFLFTHEIPDNIIRQQTKKDGKQLAKIKVGYSEIKTQPQNYAQDSVQNYLQAIAQVPLLSGEEEIVLSRQIANLLDLEKIRQQLGNKLGRQPTELEWSQEVGLPLNTFRRRLFISRQAKNKMVQSNLQLVVFIAKKYLKRGLALQDLIQEGNLGLIRATEKFDSEKGYKFSTYAYWWIRQAIMRAIADQSRTIRLPIHIHDKLSRIKKNFRLLSQNLQRVPKETELAESLEMTVEQLRFVLKAAQTPFSLETPVDREDDSRLLEDCIESDVMTPEDWVIKQSMCEEVETILSSLNSQERDVLRLRHGLDDGSIKTPVEVAEMLNLSREEINQIRGRAINKLRRHYFDSASKEYLN
ncbi:MAG: sigma-70 family RNA polymerase sigma factor [Cyanobacteria bacterium P01_G01_bin.67]